MSRDLLSYRFVLAVILTFCPTLVAAQSTQVNGEAALATGVLVIIFLIGGVVSILGVALWIWMIIDCATNEPSEGSDKIVWLLVIVLLGWLGALIYFFARRPARIRTLGR